MSRHPPRGGGRWFAEGTLTANAQNIDLSNFEGTGRSLLPSSPRGLLRVTCSGPTGSFSVVSVEINGVASVGSVAASANGAAWTFSAADGPAVAPASGRTNFRFEVDARGGTARVIRGECYLAPQGTKTLYVGGWTNSDTAVLSAMRITSAAAGAFSTGFRVTVEEI
jgi:hypothetical protein